MKIANYVTLGVAASLLCGVTISNAAIANDAPKTENTAATDHAKHKDEIALQSWSWKTKAECEAKRGKRNGTCVPSPQGAKFGWDIKMSETAKLPADESVATPTATANPTPTATATDFKGWVARVSYGKCPGGTREYVAADGGAKCWAGPD
jgi:hypothetical protein